MTALSPPAVRQLTVAARLYHVHGVRQRDIGERLGMSQTRVSRLLRRAEDEGIVRTVVAIPEGLHPDLEDVIEQAHGVPEVHVVEAPPGTTELAPVLGRAAARYLVEAGMTGTTVGFTSWSTTLQELAAALPELPRTGTSYVVEMLGDLGSPALQHAAARSTQALARALGAEPVFLRTPGVAASPELRQAALADPWVRRALGLLDDLDLALVGVGPVDVHSMLTPDDNYFSDAQLAQARASGAAGQLDQRLLDAAGQPLVTTLDDLVVGVTLDQLRRARRRVVVAGGIRKAPAIRAALRGGWVDVLVVDLGTARALLDDEPERSDPLSTTAVSV